MKDSEKRFRKYYQPIDEVFEKPKHRLYITTILSFLTISLFAWYAIRPTLQTIISLRKEIKESIEINEQMETKIANLVEAQATYQNLSPRLTILQDALPKDPDILTFVQEVRDIANENKIVIKSLTLGSKVLLDDEIIKNKKSGDSSSKKEEKVNTVSIILVAEGSYEDITSTISKIHSTKRIARISEISLSPRKNNQIVMSLTINIFSKK